MKITDEMIKAGAKAYDEVAMEGPRDYSGAYETAMQVSKDILEAALAVAPEPDDVRERIADLVYMHALCRGEINYVTGEDRDTEPYCHAQQASEELIAKFPQLTRPLAALDGAPEPVDHSELIVEARQAILAMDYVRAYQGGLIGRLADALEGLEKRNDPR